MSESSLSSLPPVEDVDLGDDTLQDLMKEAESLMRTETTTELPLQTQTQTSTQSTTAPQVATLETSENTDKEISMKTVESIGFGGNFSIDDEDDGAANTNTNSDDDGHNNNNPATDPLSAAAAAAAATAVKDTSTSDDHPLSAENLSSPPSSSATSTPPTTGNGNTNTNTATGSSAMSNILNGTSGMINNMNVKRVSLSEGAGEAAAVAAANMDSLTKTTSMFASNLATMAQRGMAQVAAATATAATNASSMSPQQQHPSMMVGQQNHQYQHQNQQQQQQQNSNMKLAQQQPWSNGMTANINAASGGVPTGGNNGIVVSQQLDKEQKKQLLQGHVGNLFQGEQVIMFLTNLLHVSDTTGLSYVASQQQQSAPIMWCCVMTYYRLILFSTAGKDTKQIDAPAGWDENCWMTAMPPDTSIRFLEIPLASMDRVEKTVYQAAGQSFMGLVIYAKDCGRVIKFTTTSYADTGRAFDSLNTYAFPGRRNLGYLFAFESKRQQVIASIKFNEETGKQEPTLDPISRRFNPMMEFPRLFRNTGITQSPWAVWTAINSMYDFSPSYPSVLAGPASLDETKPEALGVIRQCSAFRSEKRLPSLTWCGAGGSSIWRSSQPKVGLQGNRSPADELFVRHIIESARGATAMAEPPPIYPRGVLEQLTGYYSAGSGKTDPWVPEPGCGLKILDLRPRSAAMANRTGGYGYENTSNYSNTTLQFCNVQNIHAVRDSYQKLCNVCNNKSTSDVLWNSLIEDTKWLAHIRTILAVSWEVAYWVHVWRMPVLVHCSHGWDRTSQVVALSQLFLDPYYRTRRGFSVLVEKDFMSFGHPFHLRCAHGEGRSDAVKKHSQSSTKDDGQISPIFLQFLDSVYQLVELYPNAFEFNTKYLLEMSFHIYSCRFGNMLCDTEREREIVAQIRQRTNSIWDHLESEADFVNPKFLNNDGVMLMPLPTVLRSVKLWSERHFAFCPKPSSMVEVDAS